MDTRWAMLHGCKTTQHQNCSFTVRSKTSVEREALDGRTGPKLHGRNILTILYQDRNEVSQHEEVRGRIPDGRSYMDVKQHRIQNFSFTVRAARLALSVRPNLAKYRCEERLVLHKVN